MLGMFCVFNHMETTKNGVDEQENIFLKEVISW